VSQGSAERIAANEATFRDANERIRERADELEFADPVPFLCECGEAGCRDILRLSLPEYESVRRAGRTHFFVLPGHEEIPGENGRVHERNDRFVVIEKTGDAAGVAAERNPRGRD
jgi:hypothetical protein